MALLDAFFLTLINIVACLVFPKLLSVILDPPRVKHTKRLSQGLKSHAARIEITSFPYCTAYAITGSQYCKFSPHFCSQCSPN
ncbi:hypothetical protein FD725_18060 [Nostoc sp. TCL26-01]|nr:hypothetical protein FD725_18060 [Nostoc sp. TCL26-01]